VTVRNEGASARRERNTNCDFALADYSLYTSSANIARFDNTLLRFGSVVDWHAGVSITPEVTEYFTHQLRKRAYSK
jgi:hypothetical protein